MFLFFVRCTGQTPPQRITHPQGSTVLKLETLILSSDNVQTQTPLMFSQEYIPDQTFQHFPDKNEGTLIKELNSRLLPGKIQETRDETHKSVLFNKRSPNNRYHQRSLGNCSRSSSTPGQCPRILSSEKLGENPNVHQQRKAYTRCGLSIQGTITIFH